MPESFRTRLMRWAFNWWPCYWGTGARVTHIASDWRTVKVRLPLSWRTRNYVGTLFGGSLYAAVDPFFMIMLMKQLGPAYEVWDKAATIRFRKPGRTTLFATFRLEAGEGEAVRRLLSEAPKLNRTYQIQLMDDQGIVHAEVEKTLHVARRSPSC